jgi:hypothetical protein
MGLSKDFHSGITIKIFVCLLVRPILEYGVIILDSHTADELSQFKKVHQQFLRFTSHLSQISCELLVYTCV